MDLLRRLFRRMIRNQNLTFWFIPKNFKNGVKTLSCAFIVAITKKLSSESLIDPMQDLYGAYF